MDQPVRSKEPDKARIVLEVDGAYGNPVFRKPERLGIRCRCEPDFIDEMNAHIDTRLDDLDDIAAFCKSRQIVELALFGSVLRDDFSSESDIDVLVRFEPDALPTLLDMARIQDELTRMLGRQVDLVERAAIEASRNYIRREAILRSAEIFYAA